jgi:zinc protease
VNNDDPKNFENIVDKITVKDIRKWLRKFKRKADVVDIIFYPE